MDSCDQPNIIECNIFIVCCWSTQYTYNYTHAYIGPEVHKHRSSLSILLQHYFDGQQNLRAMNRWGFRPYSRIFICRCRQYSPELLAHSFQFDARLSGFWKANGLEINKISILNVQQVFSSIHNFFPFPGLCVLIFIAIEWGFLHCHHILHPNYCLCESNRQNRQSFFYIYKEKVSSLISCPTDWQVII
jgi:hypothetical protein